MSLHHEEGHAKQHGLVFQVYALEVPANFRVVVKKDAVEQVRQRFLVSENSVHALADIHGVSLGPRQVAQ
jgi:hypothetical protein